jgi:hypothetical protein
MRQTLNNQKALPDGTEGLGPALSPVSRLRASPSPAKLPAVGPGHSREDGEQQLHISYLHQRTATDNRIPKLNLGPLSVNWRRTEAVG